MLPTFEADMQAVMEHEESRKTLVRILRKVGKQ